MECVEPLQNFLNPLRCDGVVSSLAPGLRSRQGRCSGTGGVGTGTLARPGGPQDRGRCSLARASLLNSLLASASSRVSWSSAACHRRSQKLKVNLSKCSGNREGGLPSFGPADGSKARLHTETLPSVAATFRNAAEPSP